MEAETAADIKEKNVENRRSSQSGFTLMELIVAVGLMAVMFTSLSVVFQQVTNLIRRSESEIEIYQTFRLVSKIMKKDFESIVNYEDPVFYMRYDETGQYDPKLDLCGYLRLEHHVKSFEKDGEDVYRAFDNFSFLGTDASMVQLQNYVVPTGSKFKNSAPYVKTNVAGTNLVEISYAVEDKDGQIIGQDKHDERNYNRYKLLRYVRKVVPKEFVSHFEETRGLYGLIFKGDIPLTALNGKGADPLSIGMGVFNGNGKDNRIWIPDYTRISNNPSMGRRKGMDKQVEKYGKREIIAEGCTELDIKYWYYRKLKPREDWRGETYKAGAPSVGPDADGNPGKGASEDPYLLLGHFFNGCPPNPACIPTPSNPYDNQHDAHFQIQRTVGNSGNSSKYAGGEPDNWRNKPAHPNWWYLPRMMQVRMRFTDRFRILEQEFYTRIFLPSCDPRPMAGLAR